MPMTHDPLRASAAATDLLVLAGLAAIAVSARAGLPLAAGYPLKAIGCFAVVALLAMARLRDYHPFDRFGPANQITTVRAGLAALVVGLIGEPGTVGIAASVIALSLLVTLLDGVDGWLARRTRMASAFGARFDMEVDSVLILALAILAWQYGKAGPWVVLSGLLRYLFVAAGLAWSWMERPLPSTMRGKAICVVQIVVLLVVVLPAVGPPISAAVAALGLLALSYSFLSDTVWLWRQAGNT